MNINDLKYAVINVTGLSINDEYFVWLGVNGGTGNTLPDREFSYLISQGGIPGSINDMWLDLLRASGYKGSLNDMLWDFWNNGGDFTLPIVNMQNLGLVHDAAGGDLVSDRSSTATFTDYEGRVVDVLANENRFDGANRIHSLNNGNGTQTITVISGNDYQISIGSGSDNGATAVLSGGATGTLTADNVSRLSFANGTPKTVSTTSLTVTITGSIVELMVEDVTGKANQAPNNYIGNVIYNAGVAGVFYSAFESANTVDANGVVTEVQGAAISPKPTLMYEPQGINQLLYSEDLNEANWFPNEITVSLSSVVSPTGAVFSELTPTINLVNHLVNQDSNITSGQEYTQTFIVKPSGYNWVQIMNSSSFSPDMWVNFDISSGVVGSKGAAISVDDYIIEARSNGSYRIGIRNTSTATAIGRMLLSPLPSDINSRAPIFAGDGVSGILAISGNLKQESQFSSDIPTTTVAVTRDADSPNLPLVVGTNFVQEQGMAIFRFKPGYADDISDNKALMALTDAIANSFLIFGFNTAISVSDGTNAATATINYNKNDEIIFNITWNDTESQLSLNFSVNGDAYSTWTDATYDGAFLINSFYKFFLDNNYPNELVATQVYGSLPGGTIASAKTWLEANAKTLTGG